MAPAVESLALDTLGVCPRCLLLFLDGKNEHYLCSNNQVILDKLGRSNLLSTSITCSCCFNVAASIADVCRHITEQLECSREAVSPIYVKVKVPIMIDMVSKTIIKLLLFGNGDKSTNYFTFYEVIVHRMVISALKGKYSFANTENGAKTIIQVNYSLPNQRPYMLHINPLFSSRRTKRQRLARAYSNPNDDRDTIDSGSDITFADAEGFQKFITPISSERLSELQSKVIEYKESSSNQAATWSVSITSSALYILGRYRKFARDVPQSAWVIGDERKGRNSVEEIIASAVTKELQAKECKVHACGREDIDVRCLGNGRPFILEVIECRNQPTIQQLRNITQDINGYNGLNCNGDIDISELHMSDKEVWETMQNVAEEKCKAYTAVVSCSSKISQEKLQEIELLGLRDVDEEQRPCLAIIQKTPLRVLHRRSLLDRKRYIYNIETALLNDYTFLLSIITSAGTYVKEFVHGDLGRTSPSVYSTLQCDVDIVQLDVTWLFDHFSNDKFTVSVDNSRTDCSIVSELTRKWNRRQLSYSRCSY